MKKGDTVGVGKPLFGVDLDAAKPAGSPAKTEQKTESLQQTEQVKSTQPAQTPK